MASSGDPVKLMPDRVSSYAIKNTIINTSKCVYLSIAANYSYCERENLATDSFILASG